MLETADCGLCRWKDPRRSRECFVLAVNTAFHLRFGLLLAGIVLLAAGTVWAVQRSWERLLTLERKLTYSQIESFGIADEFQERLLKLNNFMLQYVARREPATWTEFEKASAELDRWIDRCDPRINKLSRVTTQRERLLLQKLNDAFNGYISAAQAVQTNQQAALASSQGLVQLAEFQGQTEGLLQLGLQLADAHRSAEQAFLGEADRSLETLRRLLLGGVAFILVLSGILGAVIYRGAVAPLRTKLVQSEAIIKRQEKLATLGTLAAGIAHEIRNPLTSVKARLYTLEKHLDSPALARNDARSISDEIGRLERIVQEVLQFARPANPTMEIIRAEEPLFEVESLMKDLLAANHVEMTVEPSPGLCVPMDKALLKQVLINMVQNSAQAIESRGRINLRVRAGRMPLDNQMQDVAVFEVSDTGAGIQPEVEKRLFDPFFTTKESGTGLGLSIAARIIQKHGGVIQYQTQPGHGTTFGIVLPLARHSAGNGKIHLTPAASSPFSKTQQNA